MVVFSSYQQDRLQDLWNKGLRNAADAFSRLTGVNVVATKVKLTLADTHSSIVPYAKNSDDLIVLATRVIGDVGGKSFLVFDANDVAVLQRRNPFDKFRDNEILNEALFKEIDNILSAAVITVMSDGLGANIYGDVPEFGNYSSSQANKIMSEYKPNGEFSIVGHSSFTLNEAPHFAPQFIWKFSSHILNMVEARSSLNK